jgi:integrase
VSYALDWRDFESWCTVTASSPLPAAPETVILYLTDLLHRLKITTARRHAAAINYYHRQAGLTLPADYRSCALFNGAQRIRCEQPRQKRAISVEQLREMCTAALPGSVSHQVRNRSILTLGFASALRRANLVALDLGDVAFAPEGLVIQIRQEKQDRKGVGRTLAVPRGKHEETCAVRSLRAWVALRGTLPGPLFLPVVNGVIQHRRLHPGTIAQAVKEAAAAIGLEADAYAGHSMRSGMVTAAFQAGLGEIAIASQTGHKSLTSLRRYFRCTDLFAANPSGMIGL